MSEIRMDVDLEHPPERIWRALTEQKLLAQWLDLPGFAPVSEAEVTGVEGHRRLAMLWGNDDLHTRLTWELAPGPGSGGATLTLRQACVYGEWDDELRVQLRVAYESVLHERLPAVLDWLAFQEVDLNAPTPSEPITEVLPFVVPGPSRRRSRIVLASAATVALLGVVVAVALFRPDGEEEPTAASTGALPSPSATGPGGVAAIGTGPAKPTASASPSPTRASATPRAESTRPPAAAALGASYETTSSRLFGYDGRVTVTNSGKAAARKWAVTITLRSGTVSDVSGAEFKQDGNTVTFTGAAVAAAGSLRFTFTVNGSALDTGPTGCQIDGKACAS
ncbi:cellulose binding domain-containing protein [Phytohabitans rumicis]|uniref:CBM2 domain-containing protein n=1 Tax=Phytohabitans rumicis TaxID=1076125 RepID=A0A6V8L976_9ACTN|nr:cellulose binding domain-containing protein [Phytohabitans rumicis]GFJ91548.1 hypothetical protein Prum_051900 [Phytohabitans rumicis]